MGCRSDGEAVMKQGLARRGGRVVLGGLAAIALLAAFVQPARATDAFPGTDDHSTTTATARWWYYGQTAQQVADLITQHDARLISIDPYWTGGGLRFAVVMVPDSGGCVSTASRPPGTSTAMTSWPGGCSDVMTRP